MRSFVRGFSSWTHRLILSFTNIRHNQNLRPSLDPTKSQPLDHINERLILFIPVSTYPSGTVGASNSDAVEFHTKIANIAVASISLIRSCLVNQCLPISYICIIYSFEVRIP